ncbi:MAG: chemotaxis protein CheW [Hyphomicrobiales bacterium]|nr:chemotaxis protein CheW [Hyphomicrobiales bacterium]
MSQSAIANASAKRFTRPVPPPEAPRTRQVFTIEISGNWFGIPIEKVRTVFRASLITSVPLAPPEVAGLVNMRGEVLTAIHLATYLGLENTQNTVGLLLVGVEHRDENFGLIVDTAGDILEVDEARRILMPTARAEARRSATLPTYRVGDMLLPLLDIEAMLHTLITPRL